MAILEGLDMLSDENKLRIFTGNANPDLAREIAAYLGTTVLLRFLLILSSLSA